MYSTTSTGYDPLYLQRLQQEAEEKARKDLNKKINASDQKLMRGMGYQTLGGGVNKYGFVQPEYTMMRDKSGNLDDRFKESLSSELQTLSDKFNVEGDTKWAQLQREQMGGQFAGARSDAAIQADTANAQALEMLAMRGGARGGARERMAMGGQLQRMRGLQDIGAQERAAGLQLSIADEEMKNTNLMNIGGERQGIMQRNIDRLSTDIANQNNFLSQKYKDDMAAYGAQQQAKAQRKASSCFRPDTLIKMKNGSLVPIKEIEIGDILFEGGKVHGIYKGLTTDLFVHGITEVAGSHAVLEDDKWIRVRDSKFATPIKGEFLVYNLAVDNHIICTQDTVFSDWYETEYYDDLTDKESLEVLNGRDVKTILQR